MGRGEEGLEGTDGARYDEIPRHRRREERQRRREDRETIRDGERSGRRKEIGLDVHEQESILGAPRR